MLTWNSLYNFSVNFRSRRKRITLILLLGAVILTLLFLFSALRQTGPSHPGRVSSGAGPCKGPRTAVTNFSVCNFYKEDLVARNERVNNLSPLLESSADVTDEAQRIHMNMFRSLIGKYKYAMLFNIAGFENKGDPAITIGEIILLRRLNIELVFHLEDNRNTDIAVDYARKLSENYSNDSLVILLHGGGNLVSYAHQDVYRERVLQRFMKFEVIMFPQSFWIFTKPDHLKHFQKAYALHPRLTFLYRDRFSYEQGKLLFPNARPFLMPDMAFQIGKVPRFMSPVHDIMWLIRTDEESTHFQLQKLIENYDVVTGDWLTWRTPKDNRVMENDFLIVANGMMFLQRGRVVITDRLHGHILSTLLDIPHVVLDPVNHKISHYRDTWTAGMDNVVYATTPEDALFKALGLLKKYDEKIPKIMSFRNSIEYEEALTASWRKSIFWQGF